MILVGVMRALDLFGTFLGNAKKVQVEPTATFKRRTTSSQDKPHQILNLFYACTEKIHKRLPVFIWKD